MSYKSPNSRTNKDIPEKIAKFICFFVPSLVPKFIIQVTVIFFDEPMNVLLYKALF